MEGAWRRKRGDVDRRWTIQTRWTTRVEGGRVSTSRGVQGQRERKSEGRGRLSRCLRAYTRRTYSAAESTRNKLDEDGERCKRWLLLGPKLLVRLDRRAWPGDAPRHSGDGMAVA